MTKLNNSSDSEGSTPDVGQIEVYPDPPRIDMMESSRKKRMLAIGGYSFYFGFSTTLDTLQNNGEVNKRDASVYYCTDRRHRGCKIISQSHKMAGNDVKAKDSENFALFKKIQDSKLILFGKFSETVTKQAKDVKWEAIRQELIAEGHSGFGSKTAKQLRDTMWSLTKTRTIGKLDAAKKTGSGGVAKFSEIEKLVLAIVDAKTY